MRRHLHQARPSCLTIIGLRKKAGVIDGDAYHKLADDSLAKIRETPANSTKCHNLQSFIVQWSPAPAVNEAKQLLEDLAKQELEAIKAIKAKATMRAKLGDFVRSYAGTAAETEAGNILGQR